MNALSGLQVAAWQRDGHASPFPLLDADELATCNEGVARFETWLGGPINGDSAHKWRSMAYLVLPWVAKLAQDPRILDRVEELLGPDLLIFTSTFFIKEARSPTIAAWHQDSTYYGLEPKEEACVWIALTEANEAAGCMEMLSFNGRPKQLRHASRIVKDSVNRGSQIIIEPLADTDPVAMPLVAGSFSIHHGLCPHRSGPNTSDHRRIGLGLNFIPTHVRPSGSIRHAAMLVRGSDNYGNFELVEPPKAELDEEAIATHGRAMSLYRDAYLGAEEQHAQLSAC